MTIIATTATSTNAATSTGNTPTSTIVQIEQANEKNMVVLELKDGGSVLIELFEDKAPKTVARFKELIKQGFYNGIVFHRVIDGFMAQTGDPTGTGTGGSSFPNLKAEFNDVSHKRGILSMARSSNPDSANSQFFIVLKDSTFLDKQYTVFGKVISGMEFVDKKKKSTSTDVSGTVSNPDKIVKMSLKNPEQAKQ